MTEAERMAGRVVQVTGSESVVFLEEGGRTIRCHLRGVLRSDASNPVVVGDRVEVTRMGTDEAVIERVEERRSALTRRAASDEREQVIIANVDQMVVVVAARKPRYKRTFVDRLLVAAENGDLEAIIVVNKTDLVGDTEAIEEEFAAYEPLAYPVCFTSAEEGRGLEPLKELLRDRISVLAGPSGVGKSSLLNAIQPGLELTTGHVSERWNKGRHITTRVTLLELDIGGFVADTPGVRAFGFWDISPIELSDRFREMHGLRAECRFSDCLHTDEPGCAVLKRVDEGNIDSRRYESYRKILNSLKEQKRRF